MNLSRIRKNSILKFRSSSQKETCPRSKRNRNFMRHFAYGSDQQNGAGHLLGETI